MKTKLFIAVLMITSITFAQKKNQVNTKSNSEAHVLIKKAGTLNNQRAMHFMQLKGIEGESNKKQSINAANNTSRYYKKRKMNEQLLNKPPKKKKSRAHYTTRKRIVVLK